MDSDLPPAPKIDGEAMLEVFVHRSMRFSGAPMSDSPYGDAQRLAALGSKALEAAYTDILFNKRPMLKADELKQQVEGLQAQVEKWVEGYRWREKVRRTAEVDLTKPEETRVLFDTYVGAVFVGGGYNAVRDWIAALVDPQAKPSAQLAAAEPEFKRAKPQTGYSLTPASFGQSHSSYYGHPPGYGQPQSPMAPPPPAVAPPPLPNNPLAPAQLHSAFLPLFNQTAQQRRLEVQYPANFSGPAHAGRWTVSCVVNGIEKGIGTGPSKQLAKEEAARQAYHNMGWAPRESASRSLALRPYIDPPQVSDIGAESSPARTAFANALRPCNLVRTAVTCVSDFKLAAKGPARNGLRSVQSEYRPSSAGRRLRMRSITPRSLLGCFLDYVDPMYSPMQGKFMPVTHYPSFTHTHVFAQY
ncbi:hypothetical protein BD413DRAFT_466224 [Trametes elegans]|nr:hypothetical protein BD413DRAFT_466224 [Trametes elegans]